MLLASVSSDLAGALVQSRNVEHDYTPRDGDDTADPAAVRALRDVLTNEEIVSLFYDPSGNLTAKTSDDAQETFVYDGNGQLREATNETTRWTRLPKLLPSSALTRVTIASWL